MSKKLEELETEINNLSKIKNWNDKIDRIKTIKTKINEQQILLNNLIDNIMNDMIEPKKKKQNIEQLFMEFNTMNNIEDKIKCYKLIVWSINKIERELFGDETNDG
jgi:hypothetical protein